MFSQLLRALLFFHGPPDRNTNNLRPCGTNCCSSPQELWMSVCFPLGWICLELVTAFLSFHASWESGIKALLGCAESHSHSFKWGPRVPSPVLHPCCVRKWSLFLGCVLTGNMFSGAPLLSLSVQHKQPFDTLFCKKYISTMGLDTVHW